MSLDVSQVSLLAGRSTAQLQRDLACAQAAYLEIMSGTRGVSYAYSQGDGAKSVTYTAANVQQLALLIRMLQQELGIIIQARRPARFLFR